MRLFDKESDEELYHLQLEKLLVSKRSYVYGSPLKQPISTAWDPVEGKYRDGYATPSSWTIRLSLRGGELGQSAECSWFVAGREISQNACDPVTEELGEGPHSVAVIIRDADGVVIEPSPAPITVVPKDILFLALGDSYGSGEGLPDVSRVSGPNARPAHWWDQRCHRSLFSPSAIAAAKLARSDPHSSVTYLSFACSGAKIQAGILGPYRGRERLFQIREAKRLYPRAHIPLPRDRRGDGMVSPQLDAALEALCPGGRVAPGQRKCVSGQPRRPDFVALSIGGNDIHFGRVVTSIVGRNCRASCDTGLTYETCKEGIARCVPEHLRELRKDFDELAPALEALDPRFVLLTEYPDPTHAAPDELCEERYVSPVGPLSWFVEGILQKGTCGNRMAPMPFSVSGITQITEEEMAAAHNHLLIPLNELIRDVAATNFAEGWIAITGIAETARAGHGFCTCDAWFNGYDDAVIRQGEIPLGLSTGVMHPNVHGYGFVGACLQRAASELMSRQSPLESEHSCKG